MGEPGPTHFNTRPRKALHSFFLFLFPFCHTEKELFFSDEIRFRVFDTGTRSIAVAKRNWGKAGAEVRREQTLRYAAAEGLPVPAEEEEEVTFPPKFPANCLCQNILMISVSASKLHSFQSKLRY
jgi:hypothetical protein